MRRDFLTRLRMCWAILRGKPVMYRCRIKEGTVMAERGGHYVGNRIEGNPTTGGIGLYLAGGSHLGG